MGNEVQYILESKRLVWLVAVVFAMVIMFQYFEFPYGDYVSSSLFSAKKTQPPVSGSLQYEASPKSPKSLDNITLFDGSNHTNPLDILEKGNKIIDNGDKNDVEVKHNSTVDKVQENGDLVTNNATLSVGNLSINNVSYSTSQEKNPDVASSPAPITPSTSIVSISPSMAIFDNNTSKADIGAPNSDHNKESATSQKIHVKKPPPMGDVVTISNMYDILLYNRANVRSMVCKFHNCYCD